MASDPLLLELILIGLASVIVSLGNLFKRRSSATGNSTTRLDTPEKAIEREKKRYVEGDIPLEKFEERVYQKIPIEEPK